MTDTSGAACSPQPHYGMTQKCIPRGARRRGAFEHGDMPNCIVAHAVTKLREHRPETLITQGAPAAATGSRILVDAGIMPSTGFIAA